MVNLFAQALGKARLSLIPFACVFIILIWPLASCTKRSDGDDVLALVNGQKVTLADFQNARDFATGYLPNLRDLGVESASRLNQALLEQLINEKLLLEEADKKGVHLGDSDLTNALERATVSFPGANVAGWLYSLNLSIDAWQELIKERLVIKKLVSQEVDSKVVVSQDEVADYYKANTSEFDQPEQREVSHVQVRSMDLAKLIISELKKGRDFSQIVEAYSNAVDRVAGGRLGWVAKNNLPDSFGESIFGIEKVGNLSPVVETAYGFHIFKMTGLKPASHLNLEQAKPEIIARLKVAKTQEQFVLWFEGLQKAAKIERFSERLSQYNDI